MTNFDIFAANPQFEPFASVAVSAERILHIDPSACVLNCRRAMEFAVKWMYSVDKALVMPYQDSLVSLMNTEDFRDIVGADIWRRMDLIRRMGNNAAHTGKKITQEQAALCLENLYILLDFVAYCYGENYTEGHFDHALLTQKSEVSAEPVQEVPEVELAALMAKAPRPVRIQDLQAVYRHHAHRCRLDGEQGLAERSRTARYAKQVRGRLCRLCALR